MFGEDGSFINEFSEYKDRVRELIVGNELFAELLKEYEHLNKQICCIDEQLEVRETDYTNQLRSRQVEIRKKLYSMLRS